MARTASPRRQPSGSPPPSLICPTPEPRRQACRTASSHSGEASKAQTARSNTRHPPGRVAVDTAPPSPAVQTVSGRNAGRDGRSSCLIASGSSASGFQPASVKPPIVATATYRLRISSCG
jgi:hypothetical protein